MSTSKPEIDWSTKYSCSTVWPPRQIWPDERRDLSPWVAAHLSNLGNKLGMRLNLVRREAPIGRLKADIEAIDDRGRRVIIENQLGPTDPDHLGKIMTYGRLGADVVVWLVAGSQSPLILHGFRPEHRQLLHELNEKFGPKIEFYGVELSVESKPKRLGTPSGPPLQILRVVVAPKGSGKPEKVCRAEHRLNRAPNGEAGSFHLAHFCDFADVVIVLARAA